MNYQEALEYIHGTYRFGSKLGLENILSLLELMNNPQDNLQVIHVAGTNGKGSTTSFIGNVLMEEGYRVGLYTSPYIEKFTERIRINGADIPERDLAEITEYVKEKVEIMLEKGKNHPTEFEIVTAIAFEYFSRKNVDLVVLEVGLGGRGDSTNVIKQSLVSVITPIDYDHTQYLGDTLAKIAYEKAGIIKSNSIVVSYPQQKEAMEVIERECKKQNSRLIIVSIDKINVTDQDIRHQIFDLEWEKTDFKSLTISLLGDHQVKNAVVALTALNILQQERGIVLSKRAIYEGFKKTQWPGRLEIMGSKPMVLIDGAHNVHGLKALANVLDKYFSNNEIILCIGVLGDKDVKSMLDIIIPKVNKVVATEPVSPRALSVEELAFMMNKYNLPMAEEKKITNAVSRALKWANEDSVIVFCGSFYMIGEVRTILRRRKNN